MIALSQKASVLKKSLAVLRDVVLHAITMQFISLMQKAFRVCWVFIKKVSLVVRSADKNKPTCEGERSVHHG